MQGGTLRNWSSLKGLTSPLFAEGWGWGNVSVKFIWGNKSAQHEVMGIMLHSAPDTINEITRPVPIDLWCHFTLDQLSIKVAICFWVLYYVPWDIHPAVSKTLEDCIKSDWLVSYDCSSLEVGGSWRHFWLKIQPINRLIFWKTDFFFHLFLFFLSLKQGLAS